ncbi:MAG: Na+/H+ antiporter family protein [Moraxella sp.]|nr:Na+/H+ antiporter family protein [Moraxella sp.]
MNAVLLSVVVMLGLSLSRVNVVLSLLIGAMVGGVIAGMPLKETLEAFEKGMAGGASIALSYAILGAFAMAIAESGLPKLLAKKAVLAIDKQGLGVSLKYGLFLLLGLLAMASQNIVPIHIAFIPLIVPPLLLVFDRLRVDRRAIACVLTFGLVNTYMFIPYGFGDIFLNQIILGSIKDAGVTVENLSIMRTMAIPALGMLLGLLCALFFSYRKPRTYQSRTVTHDMPASEPSQNDADIPIFGLWVSLFAIVLAFVVQLLTSSLLIGAAVGFGVFMVTGVVKWHKADTVFGEGIKMMAMIGFIMICAQGFAEVMRATGQIDGLVTWAVTVFDGQKSLAVLAMLFVGLLVTMGIGSSFSTVPILAAIYVPLCVALGLSVPATVALVAVSGVLGDAGSPASDSTLGPTMGLNADGQHDHIKDTVIPTFIHYNIPLIVFGWLAVMML